MNIAILTSTNLPLRKLLAEDLAGAKTGPAASDVSGAAAEAPAPIKPRPTGNVAPSTKFPSMRAALDARIAGDVVSGQLSANDATAVHTTLDAIENRSQPGRSVPVSLAAQHYLATIPRGTLVDRIG